jgi:hypothetical protein
MENGTASNLLRLYQRASKLLNPSYRQAAEVHLDRLVKILGQAKTRILTPCGSLRESALSLFGLSTT